MNRRNLTRSLMLLTCLSGCVACSTSDEEWSLNEPTMESPSGMNNGTLANDGNTPEFDSTIYTWDGTTADDASTDVTGTDEDIYHEANTFTHTVAVTYDGATATVESSTPDILCHTTGAYVTLDMQTNEVSKVEIILKGQSDDGGLKVYGAKKFKLTLDGVSLTSQKGPAINSQCKKRIFLHLTDGTTNSLTDAASYAADDYYLDPTDTDEDRKGCLFSEGNLVFSGTGVLQVAGRNKHGIATDGCLLTRPGVTLVVSEAAKNCIHVKGDEDDGIGVRILGGLIYAHTSATAGKGIKTDLDVDNSNDLHINGGIVLATGGTLQSTPSTGSTQRSVVCNGLTLSKGALLTVLDASSAPLLTLDVQRSMNGATFFFSHPDLQAGTTYTLASGGTLTAYTDSWNGWYASGTWSGGSTEATFTPSSTVTTVGNAGGMGGSNPGGNNGGRPGGGW